MKPFERVYPKEMDLNDLKYLSELLLSAEGELADQVQTMMEEHPKFDDFFEGEDFYLHLVAVDLQFDLLMVLAPEAYLAHRNISKDSNKWIRTYLDQKFVPFVVPTPRMPPPPPSLATILKTVADGVYDVDKKMAEAQTAAKHKAREAAMAEMMDLDQSDEDSEDDSARTFEKMAMEMGIDTHGTMFGGCAPAPPA